MTETLKHVANVDRTNKILHFVDRASCNDSW